ILLGLSVPHARSHPRATGMKSSRSAHPRTAFPFRSAREGSSPSAASVHSGDYPRDACIHELFEAQADLSPDAIAVVDGERSLSYRELSHRGNRLARRLSDLGIGIETPVGICMERSADMIVATLGVLQAGGAYV